MVVTLAQHYKYHVGVLFIVGNGLRLDEGSFALVFPTREYPLVVLKRIKEQWYRNMIPSLFRFW